MGVKREGRGRWYIQSGMGDEGGRPDPIAEELARARETTRRFWLLQWLRIPDFGEAADGWATLPRAGKWVTVLLVIGIIMLLPAIAILVALLD